MGFFDRFTRRPTIVKDQWDTYAYRFGEDERCIVKFDVTACDPAEQRPSPLRRVIGFSPEGEISPTGMPSPSAFARLTAIEDALIAELEKRRVKAWLIGTQVYRGFRELLFQVDDVAGFASAYAIVEAKFGGMELVDHEDWSFFNDKISPGVRGQNHIGNRDVMTALADAGSDLSLPHLVDHTFVGPAASLDAIEAELNADGFHRASRDGRSLTISKETPLDDQDEIDDLTMALRELADAHGARYDGWGAPVTR